MVRVIVFVVPMTPSPMIMRPSNPSRSPMCVAWKESFLQVMEMNNTPKNSTVKAIYIPIKSHMMLAFAFVKPPNNPPKVAAMARNRKALRANGRVRRW